MTVRTSSRARRPSVARRFGTVGTALALLCGAAVGTGQWASAAWDPTLGTSTFEIDESANLVVDTSGNIDWADVNPGAGVSAVNFQDDQASGSNDNAFGKGTSENDPVPTRVSGSIPPNKSDLTAFGVYDGEQGYVHLAWARVQDPSGTTNMDFEFNQSNVLSANGVTPVRTAGDLLIEYHLGNGGATATLSKRTWSGTAWSDPPVALGGNAIGSINSAAITAANSGDLNHSLSARTFGEATIDLTQIFGTDTCRHFGSAYLKSRSSDSFSSEIKDFIAPEAVNLTNCRSLVVEKLGPSGSTRLTGATFELVKGTTHYALPESTTPGIYCIDNLDLGTYTLHELTPPTGYTAASDSSVVISTSSSQANCTQRLTGTITVDVQVRDNPQPGSITVLKRDDSTPTALGINGVSFSLYVDASPTNSYGPEDSVLQAGPTSTSGSGSLTWSNVPLGTYCVVEGTAPTGYDAAAPQCGISIDVVSGGDTETVTFVNARQHRIIVLVCHEGTDTLDPSSVTLGASTKTSLGAGSLTAAQQKALCDLGGASFGNLSGHSARSLSVTPG